jgi:hypothetical protein
MLARQAQVTAITRRSPTAADSGASNIPYNGFFLN